MKYTNTDKADKENNLLEELTFVFLVIIDRSYKEEQIYQSNQENQEWTNNKLLQTFTKEN